MRNGSDEQSDAFFTHEGIEEVQKRIKGLNACSEFLREHVEHEKEEIIAGETNDVNQRWNDLQVLFYCSIQFFKHFEEIMRQVVKRNELRANEDKFRENVEKVQKWLSETEELLQQSIVTQLDEIADYEQTLALVKNEQMNEMEKLYRTTSTAAQVVCRNNPSKELTKQKLKIMSQIKDRYISVRETVDKALEAASNLQTPLNSLEEIYNDVQSWHDEAEEVLESYEDPNCGLEDIDRLLELHAAQFGEEMLNEVETNISRMRKNVATVNEVKMPKMDSSDVENRVLQLNRAVENMRRQAANWGPRIDSLSRKWDDLQKWIKDSEDALNDSEGFLTQKEVPKKEELEELADTVSKLLSKAPMIKCDFDDLKQNLERLSRFLN